MSSRNTLLNKILSFAFLITMVLPSSFAPVSVLASQDQGGQCVTEIVSDSQTLVNGAASVATYDEHVDWTASIPGATWIWSTYKVEDPLVVTTKTFARQFNLASGSVADSILTIAADNSFKVLVNGTEVASEQTGDSFFETNKKTYNVSSYLNSGSNTVTFEVTNLTHPQALTPETNPAGLLYSLRVVQNGSCGGDTTPPPAQDPTVNLTATPSVITAGESSSLAWTSSNADSCSSTWFDGMGTAGSTNVSPATTTDYVISCVGNSKTVYATTTVTVNTNTGGNGPSCTIDIVSDATNTVNGTVTPSVATYNNHPRWTASIPGATWIWKTLFVENPTQDEYYTFLKQFNVSDVSKVKTASLVVAADNSYTVNLNGTEFAADATETNYFNEEKDTYDVKSRLINGNNAIYFVVKNWAIEGATAETNPAGLLYKLSITLEGSDCGGNGGTTTPSVSLGANPSTINVGATSTLSWVSTNTNYCSASWTTATSTSGSMVVSPATTTDYAISCGGNYGTTTATTTVIVNSNNNGGGSPTPSVTLTANPQSIAPGATSTLVWNSSNTNYCTAGWTNATSTSGSFVVTPGVTTDYSISCGGTYGTTTATTTVTVTTGGGNGGSPTPSITLTANPTSVTPGASSTLSWVSNNTNYCTAAWTTATSTSGSMEVSLTSTTDYSISCGGNYGTTTATTTVTVNTDNNGGGNGGGGNGGGNGGGGSNIGGRRRDISNLLAPQGEVLGATSCSYLRDHLKMGWNNDSVEMLKLKSFLNVFEKENLSLDSNFDQATFDAVSRFQNKYFAEVLAPWGHTAPTGFVYITTKKKINEIYCNAAFPLTSAEAEEIVAFKAMIEGGYFGSSSDGSHSDILSGLYDDEVVVGANTEDDVSNTSTTSTSTSPVSVVKNMAVSLFSIPDGLQDFFSNSRNVIFAIIALIVLSVVARMFLYSGDENEELVSESSSVSSSNTGAASTMKDDSPVIVLPGENKENKA